VSRGIGILFFFSQVMGAFLRAGAHKNPGRMGEQRIYIRKFATSLCTHPWLNSSWKQLVILRVAVCPWGARDCSGNPARSASALLRNWSGKPGFCEAKMRT
jgi:hypothetical protein